MDASDARDARSPAVNCASRTFTAAPSASTPPALDTSVATSCPTMRVSTRTPMAPAAGQRWAHSTAGARRATSVPSARRACNPISERDRRSATRKPCKMCLLLCTESSSKTRQAPTTRDSASGSASTARAPLHRRQAAMACSARRMGVGACRPSTGSWAASSASPSSSGWGRKAKMPPSTPASTAASGPAAAQDRVVEVKEREMETAASRSSSSAPEPEVARWALAQKVANVSKMEWGSSVTCGNMPLAAPAEAMAPSACRPQVRSSASSGSFASTSASTGAAPQANASRAWSCQPMLGGAAVLTSAWRRGGLGACAC